MLLEVYNPELVKYSFLLLDLIFGGWISIVGLKHESRQECLSIKHQNKIKL